MLIRPGMMSEDEPEPPIAGVSIGTAQIMERLGPALQIAWPDHPAEPEDLKAFLETAAGRLLDAAMKLKDEPGFVPAASFTRLSRERTFEYVCAELEDVRGGVETEDLWQAFDALDATAPIRRIAHAGLAIKLRALGAFILFGPTWRDDEMNAADFFPKGAWEASRDAVIAEILERGLSLTNKQVAHITLTRPLPEDIEVYGGSAGPELELIVQLFDQFDGAVDHRLLPAVWSHWWDDFRSSWA